MKYSLMSVAIKSLGLEKKVASLEKQSFGDGVEKGAISVLKGGAIIAVGFLAGAEVLDRMEAANADAYETLPEATGSISDIATNQHSAALEAIPEAA